MLPARFHAWRQGSRQQLVAWWAADRARSRQAAQRRAARPRSRRRAQEDTVAQVLTLIEEGEISRALRALHSSGIAQLTLGVLQQLAAKHPVRSRPVPATLPLPPVPRVPIVLTETFRGLRRRAQPGRSGLRNEFLRVLVGGFDDARADRVMPMYDTFATDVAACAFPPWFYSAWAIAGLTPLVKRALTPEEEARRVCPDVRPIAVGEAALRAIWRQMAAAGASAAADILRPQQVAVGVSGGLSILVHGVRMLVEMERGFVVVKLDMRNGYNAVSRSVLLRRLSHHPQLAHWVPFLHLLSGPGSDLLVGQLAASWPHPSQFQHF